MVDTSAGTGTSCFIPKANFEVVRLGHGSGGKMTSDLIEHLFLPELGNPILNQLEDAALLELTGTQIVMTTDAFVVSPIFFPGGDIGSLSVHGTINDLAMRGARPRYLTATFILEEGLRLDELHKVVQSFGVACRHSDILIAACDTKVVGRGAADKLFITTTGVGVVDHPSPPAASGARVGDSILVSGEIGLHGMAIMCAREGLGLESTIESDSAPLFELVADMLATGSSVHCLRDITRGGLASVLNELAASSKVGIEIWEGSVPVNDQVAASCEILGLDPLYVASEGRLVAIVDDRSASELLQVMGRHPAGRGACIIGKVVDRHQGRVAMTSRIGGRRILDKLSGEQLPRIC